MLTMTQMETGSENAEFDEEVIIRYYFYRGLSIRIYSFFLRNIMVIL